MRRMAWRVAGGMLWLTLVSGPARSDDDLTVVKRAMAREDSQSSAALTAEADLPPTRGERVPQWLKIRILDKSSRQTRVSLNLPLGLVRALGGDLAVDLSGQGHARTDDGARGHRAPTLRELLGLLQAGQQIVEIDSDEARVRVWVE